MEISHIIILALIQGITEFLPVSSSAHLIIPAQVFNWEDQGIAFDVAVHVGTLLAVIIYYLSDLVKISTYTIESAIKFKQTPISRVGWYLILATIPAGLCGLFFESYVATLGRSIEVIAYATIGFGILLGIASYINRKLCWRTLINLEGARADSLRHLTLSQALVVGFAQCLALIPGTSRSGITLTAGLFLGMRPEAAARFSFLLSIPIILASGLFEFIKLVKNDGLVEANVAPMLMGLVISFITAIIVIHMFMKYISKSGMAIFVIYRVLLGAVLLYIANLA